MMKEPWLGARPHSPTHSVPHPLSTVNKKRCHTHWGPSELEKTDESGIYCVNVLRIKKEKSIKLGKKKRPKFFGKRERPIFSKIKMLCQYLRVSSFVVLTLMSDISITLWIELHFQYMHVSVACKGGHYN